MKRSWLQEVSPQARQIKQFRPPSIDGEPPVCGHRGGPKTGRGNGRRIGSIGGHIRQSGRASSGRRWRGPRGGNGGDHHPEDPRGPEADPTGGRKRGDHEGRGTRRVRHSCQGLRRDTWRHRCANQPVVLSTGQVCARLSNVLLRGALHCVACDDFSTCSKMFLPQGDWK